MTLKKFNKLVHEWTTTSEQQDPAAAPAPAPGANELPVPGAGEASDSSPAPLSPAAEVTLVRLLLKALVINIEDSDLSTLSKLDQPEINQENAEQVKQDLIGVINNQQTRGQNEDRIETINSTMNSINERNSKSMLNRFLDIMKRYSNVNIK